jgi:hypothetical protein
VENEHFNQKADIFSKKVKAGKRRTYFFDVRTTKSNDFFLTITESTKSFENDTYERHKIFIYKEDFNKFAEALLETVDYIKGSLLPEYNFDQFAHKDWENEHNEPKNEIKKEVINEDVLKEPTLEVKNEDAPTPSDEDLKW